MRIIALLLVTGIGFLGMSCSNDASKEKKSAESTIQDYKQPLIKPDNVESITLNDSISGQLIIRGREITIKTQAALKAELSKVIQEKGLAHAVSFCSQRALEITDSVALAEQVMIKRLAKKNRNPNNAMDENESNLYKSFVIEGLTSRRIPSHLGWDDKGHPVYYRTIPTKSLCLNCHGTPRIDISAEVTEKIAELYPDDKAIDFKVGHPRGMWAITFPEFKVVDVELSKPVN